MASAIPPRRQSKRQPLRTSTTRPTNYYARSFGGTEAQQPAPEREPGFFPAIQHFTDCAYALPKEITSHVAMLKEVEAKIHAPEQGLHELVNKISDLPPAQRYQATGHTAVQSLAGSANGSVYNGNASPALRAHLGREIQSSQPQASIEELQRNELNRRELCKAIFHTINWMNPILDEKIAVLHTANESLRMQLERMNSSYRNIDNEISAEARLGSAAHWAYVDRGEAKKVVATGDRTRRDGVRALAEAAEGDLVASRSEARREAMLAKKHRTQHVDSDFDDRPASKKQQGSKAKKPAADTEKAIGLGISNGSSTVPKKRKIAQAPEKSMASALAISKGGSGSPRELPGSDFALAKRKKPGPAPGTKKKPLNSNSSPALPPITLNAATSSSASRPHTARARQNSHANSTTANAGKAQQVGSSASNRPSAASGTPNLKPMDIVSEAAGSAELRASAQSISTVKEEAGNWENAASDLADDTVSSGNAITARVMKTSKPGTPVVGTFPSDPLGGRARPIRNGGNANSNGVETVGSVPNGKKSHRKNGGSISHPATLQGPNSESRRGSVAAEAPGGEITQPVANADAFVGSTERTSSRPQRKRRHPAAIHEDEALDMPATDDEIAEDEAGSGEEEEEDNDRTYCYCNDAGTGTMVGCDNDDCPRQWFHLQCVGLKEAPDENEKWYCPECTKAMGSKR